MKPPLYVDLDGTLIRADTMQQASLLLLRDHPWQAIRALLAMRHGRHAAKDIVAAHVTLDAAHFPYRTAVLDYVRDAKAQGRRVILATGSHKRYADAVAAHVGIFDAVMATEKEINLIGPHKLEQIRADCGEDGFEYLGDSGADIVIFEASHTAGMVGGRRFQPLTNAKVSVHQLGHLHNNRLPDLIRLLRPHQWVKNVLVFLPLFASHRLDEARLVLATIATFIIFSLISSANYILNDLFDCETDRRHPAKRDRPIASGAVTIPRAILLSAVLMAAGLIGAALVTLPLLWVMLSYLLLANLYSFQLKRRLLVDVIALAGMYTLRPIAGGAATAFAELPIVLSTWLLAFCMFFFACIAFAKRYTELRMQVSELPQTPLPGRGYQTADLDILRVVGPVNGYLAVMVIALYISSPAVKTLYARPEILWLICPVLGYWLTRLWFLAHRGVLHDDPVVFALKDAKSYLAVGVCLAIGIAASVF
ncbi:MAG: UbiA family prenyltransferase [Burkholderiales bacterium]|nr:UbiA family prenyltransferase [Phycisphaerae bacterium]